MDPLEMTGAQVLVRCLELEDCGVIFGIPGGAVLPLYDALHDSSLRQVLGRHEQGVGHMAEGFAHVSGRPGVAIVTSGPGLTNVITPIADAMSDSIPIVVISGQVPSDAIGTDAFQECPSTALTAPVVKRNWLVLDGAEIPLVVRQAFRLAATGRPGPVHIDVPKDVLAQPCPWSWPSDDEVDASLGLGPVLALEESAVTAAARLLLDAERPVLYVGGGVLKAGASAELRELAELCNLHVVSTLMARGAFPDSHRLALGMPGMHGNYTAITALQRSDLLVALGARFDDRVTSRVESFAPDAKVIHADVDPGEMGKVRTPDVALVADCRVAIRALTDAVHHAMTAGQGPPDRTAWHDTIAAWQCEHPLRYEPARPGDLLKPQFVFEQLRNRLPADAIVASGVGQHQMWASQYLRFDHPRTWVNSGGLGTMGFGIPAAIGAKVARPDAAVWVVDGDGCFQMTAQELVTASVEGIPIKVALFNNTFLGMVRQWQELFHDQRFSGVDLSRDLPDYCGWATAMGCLAIRVETPGQVGPAIDRANATTDRPVVIEFRTDPTEKVFPMVASGSSNDDVVLGIQPPEIT